MFIRNDRNFFTVKNIDFIREWNGKNFPINKLEVIVLCNTFQST